MRKFVIAAALAASTLAVASPAAAQYYPPQGYGHDYNYGQVRRLQVRIDRLQNQIVQLDRRNIISNREAGRLREQSREIERQLRYSARNGLNPHEANAFEHRIARLEQRLHRDANDGNRWGNNDQWRDRDRDGGRDSARGESR